MKLCHFKDDSETSTRAVRQNASVVRTLFDLFLNIRVLLFLHPVDAFVVHQKIHLCRKIHQKLNVCSFNKTFITIFLSETVQNPTLHCLRNSDNRWCCGLYFCPEGNNNKNNNNPTTKQPNKGSNNHKKHSIKNKSNRVRTTVAFWRSARVLVSELSF